MRYFIFLVAVAAMAGCVESSKYSPNQAVLVPSSRLYGFTKKSDVHLVVVRDQSDNGRCTIRFSIDGKPAADFEAREVANFGLTMGVHWLSALPARDCSDLSIKNVRIAVKTGDGLIMRIDQAGLSSGAM
jgi:hypothetical protein